MLFFGLPQLIFRSRISAQRKPANRFGRANAAWIGPMSVAIAGLLIATPALADRKIGVVLGIENSASGTDGDKVRDLAKDDPVFRDEKIVTQPASKASLIFDDFTTLSIGASSTIVLDEFVYQPNGTQKITFNALKGAFRFVTGRARKKAYKVVTPTAVIGVRGTDFGVYVNKLGETLTLLRNGAIRVCLLLHDAAGVSRPSDQCAEATAPNTYVRTSSGQIFGPVNWNGSNPFQILDPTGRPDTDGGDGSDSQPSEPDNESPNSPSVTQQ